MGEKMQKIIADDSNVYIALPCSVQRWSPDRGSKSGAMNPGRSWCAQNSCLAEIESDDL